MSVSITIPWSDDLSSRELLRPIDSVGMGQDLTLLYDNEDPDADIGERVLRLWVSKGNSSGDVYLDITDQDRFTKTGSVFSIELRDTETALEPGTYYVEVRDTTADDEHIISRALINILKSPKYGVIVPLPVLALPLSLGGTGTDLSDDAAGVLYKPLVGSTALATLPFDDEGTGFLSETGDWVDIVSMAIGVGVQGAGANRVLHTNALGQLSQTNGFTFTGGQLAVPTSLLVNDMYLGFWTGNGVGFIIYNTAQPSHYLSYYNSRWTFNASGFNVNSSGSGLPVYSYDDIHQQNRFRAPVKHYQSLTDESNYSRLHVGYHTGYSTYAIAVENAGTGFQSTLQLAAPTYIILGTGGGQWILDNLGRIVPNGSNALDFGSAASRVRRIYASQQINFSVNSGTDLGGTGEGIIDITGDNDDYYFNVLKAINNGYGFGINMLVGYGFTIYTQGGDIDQIDFAGAGAAEQAFQFRTGTAPPHRLWVRATSLGTNTTGIRIDQKVGNTAAFIECNEFPPPDVSNYSRLQTRYDGVASRYVIEAVAAGTGTLRNMIIQWGSGGRFFQFGNGINTSERIDALAFASGTYVSASSYWEMHEAAEPDAPPAGRARRFLRDNGAGKMQYCIKWPSGAVSVISTEP